MCQEVRDAVCTASTVDTLSCPPPQPLRSCALQMSVKCYALLAYDELVRPGAAMLALHRKPADYKRRGQHPAYTSKPMYLHIVRTLAKH